MDDQLANDQLSLWDKLNRLYGNTAPGSPELKRDIERQGEEEDAGVVLEDKQDTDQEEKSAEAEINEICSECEQNCKQIGDKFILSLCPKNEKNVRPDFQQMSPLCGYSAHEKINQTCRNCIRSCKQTTPKVNVMLCLGFESLPTEDEV
ncbi:MAG TPA: hypothetical protein VM123_19110 [archaeon]|nr:hypothetical protein [archaeon]